MAARQSDADTNEPYVSASIPAQHPQIFIGPIVHPLLYLWDSWCYQERQKTHLYCLAVNRFGSDGAPLAASSRNERPFHVRHFLSSDAGETWSDEGCFQKPQTGNDRFDSKTIWSGSIARLPDGKKLVAYTGLRESAGDLHFRQSIGLAISENGHIVDRIFPQALSCPIRDWQTIIDAGYFLGERSQLGHMDGENGGPILAWRDPYIFINDNEIHLFWAAKVSSHRPAIAHVKIEERANGTFNIVEMFKPVVVPDSDQFTQLELPKILYDRTQDQYYLLISTCNRLYEGQNDSDVDKKIRIYHGPSIDGPWVLCTTEKSEMQFSKQHMFGLSILYPNFEKAELRCISPITEAANSQIALSLSRAFTVKLKP